MLMKRGMRQVIMLATASLLIGCAVSYEAAQEKYQKGEVTEAREAWSSLANEGDPRSMYQLYATGSANNDGDIQALKQAAKLGYAPAQYDYGLLLISQQQFTPALESIALAAKQQFASAEKWQQSHPVEILKWPLADKGNTYSMLDLGEHYKNQKQYQDAYYWFKKAAQSNSSTALFYMGVMYDFGYYVKKDEKTAVQWYQKAVKEGSSSAAFNLCVGYQQDSSVTKNPVVAREFCQIAADRGHGSATTELGRMYLQGIGGEKDANKAADLLLSQANNDTYAAYHLANIYYDGIGRNQDYNKAFYWYEKAKANKELTTPARRMGIMYEDGLGKNKNDSLAFKYYMEAAERGDSYSQQRVGHFYNIGRGTEKDLPQAAIWFEKAAKQGQKISAYYIGLAYLKGSGIKVNYDKAEQYLLQSANAGDADAQFQLGFQYNSGKKFAKSDDKFFAWTQKAAHQQHEVAQYNLSVAYINGWGTKKNYAWAAYWRAKSAKQGYDSAIDNLPLLLDKLTPLTVNQTSQVKLSSNSSSDNLRSVKKGTQVYRLGGNTQWTEILLADDYTIGYVPSKTVAKTNHLANSPSSNQSGATFPAKPAKVAGRVSCNTRCVNSTCYRTYDDGRQIKFQAKSKYNAFTGQFEWDSGGC